jgi:hypothetical protein
MQMDTGLIRKGVAGRTSLRNTQPMTEEGGANASVTGAKLRAESDTFVAQLQRLLELEAEKRNTPPTDPRFVGLAIEVEEAASALLDDARGQIALGDAASAAGVSDPIAVISPDLSAIQLISGWRDAERKLAGLPPRSDEARNLRLTIDAYRRAYQATFKERRNRSS